MPAPRRIKAIRAFWHQQIFTVGAPVSISVSSAYVLDEIPQQTSNLVFSLGDGVAGAVILRPTTDYTVSGDTITYLGGQALTTTNYFIAYYIAED